VSPHGTCLAQPSLEPDRSLERPGAARERERNRGRGPILIAEWLWQRRSTGPRGSSRPFSWREYGNPVEANSLRVRFGQVAPDELGRCSEADGIALVTIDEKKWERLNEMARESLVFHELGHCLLARDHVTEWLPDESRPRSLMNEYLVSGKVYSSHQQAYLEELFRRE
jgi:hypothetical protein